MSLKVVEQVFQDGKRQDINPYNQRWFGQPLHQAIDDAFQPLRTFFELILTLNPRSEFGETQWPEGMEKDIATVADALTRKAEQDLTDWERSVSKHLGIVCVEQASYRNEEYPPLTHMGVRVIRHNGQKQKGEE
jgi:hypothetical protein